jgi:hypothetical protein
MGQMNVMTYPGVVLDQKVKRCFFEGSTAITKGYGYAYNRDSGTAATAEQKRSTNIEVLTYANAADFAGVALESKAAVTGGQFVDIACPGSDCLVYTSETSLTVNSGRIHCRADATAPGVFINKAGIKGNGSAVPLQTISAAGLILVHLDEGDQNGCVEVLTCTAGGATNMMARGGTSCFATATVASDATFTLAAGTFIGQLRSFQTEGTQTTSDISITLTGIKADGTTSFTSWKGNADAEDLNVWWNGTAWVCSQAGTGAFA